MLFCYFFDQKVGDKWALLRRPTRVESRYDMRVAPINGGSAFLYKEGDPPCKGLL